MKVSIAGLDKAQLLKALHDRSKAQGMSFLEFNTQGLSLEQCRELIASGCRFDYLQGRIMKVDLTGDEFDAWGYDRDNGEGAAQKIVSSLRRQQTAA